MVPTLDEVLGFFSPIVILTENTTVRSLRYSTRNGQGWPRKPATL
ncbi:MAG TPA: hypothetical protein VIH34_03650 [Candidatus Bathyarchaeia archaeon]